MCVCVTDTCTNTFGLKDKHKQKLGVGDVPYTAEKVPYFYIQAKATGHHLPLVDFANAAMLLGSMTKGPLVWC